MAKRKPAKRRYGSGSVYENKDGSYTAQAYSGGKLVRRRCATREAAEAALAELNQKKAAGVDLPAGAQTVETFVNYWYNEVVMQREIKPRTRQHYLDTCERYILPALGMRRLDSITGEDLQTLLNDMRRRPKPLKALSAQTVNHAHGVLKQIFTKAWSMHYLLYNPAADLEVPKVKRQRKDAPTAAQVRAFLAAIEGYRLATAYHVMATLGTRLGETLAIRRIDIDFDAAILTINEQTSYHTNTAAPTKNDHPRPLPIPPRLLARLRAQWESVRPEAEWKNHGLLFPSADGTRKQPSNFEKEWHGWTERKNGAPAKYRPGLRELGKLPDDTTIHDFRRFCATSIGGMDVNTATIGHILGHGAANVTELYIRRMLSTMRRALEAHERELWNDHAGEQEQIG